MIEYAGEPFQWGVLDCCQFAARVAEQITGRDYSEGFEYWSESQAEAIISRSGDLSSLVSAILGQEPVSIEELEVGDPCLVSIPVQGEMMGVFNGRNAIIKMKARAHQVDSSRILKGWHLG